MEVINRTLTWFLLLRTPWAQTTINLNIRKSFFCCQEWSDPGTTCSERLRGSTQTSRVHGPWPPAQGWGPAPYHRLPTPAAPGLHSLCHGPWCQSLQLHLIRTVWCTGGCRVASRTSVAQPLTSQSNRNQRNSSEEAGQDSFKGPCSAHTHPPLPCRLPCHFEIPAVPLAYCRL